MKAFVSSLEERQKDCRLYIDRIGDILLTHIPSMAVYTVRPNGSLIEDSLKFLFCLLQEYCVNQTTANKVLQSLKQTNPALVEHLNVSLPSCSHPCCLLSSGN